MPNFTKHCGKRIVLAALAALALSVYALPAASAQGRMSGQGGGGWHQDRSGQHGHQWGERTESGGTVYHRRPSYMSHPYRGSEHRRYYTYQGSEFYINLDNGIRIAL